MEGYFKIGHRVSELLFVEVFDNISKLQSVTMKWPAGSQTIHVSQKKRTNRSLCICYLKVIEGQVCLSTLCGTLRICVNSSFLGYFDGLEKSTFKSYEKIYTIDFSLSLEMKSLTILRNLAVLNCKLIENVLHIFCSGQSWYDLCIL